MEFINIKNLHTEQQNFCKDPWIIKDMHMYYILV